MNLVLKARVSDLRGEVAELNVRLQEIYRTGESSVPEIHELLHRIEATQMAQRDLERLIRDDRLEQN